MEYQRTPVSEGQAREVGRMIEDAVRRYKGGKEKLELAKGHPKFISEIYAAWDRLAAEREQVSQLPVVEQPAWKVIKIGMYNSADQYRQELKRKGIRVYKYANKMMNNPAFKLVEPITLKLVRVTVNEFGFPQGTHRENFYKKVLSRGWQLCPPEVGPALVLLQKESVEDEPLGMNQVAMERIWHTDLMDPCVFSIGQLKKGHWCLSAHWGGLMDFCKESETWIFCTYS